MNRRNFIESAADFEKRGGKIRKIKSGVSGYTGKDMLKMDRPNVFKSRKVKK